MNKIGSWDEVIIKKFNNDGSHETIYDCSVCHRVNKLTQYRMCALCINDIILEIKKHDLKINIEEYVANKKLADKLSESQIRREKNMSNRDISSYVIVDDCKVCHKMMPLKIHGICSMCVSDIIVEMRACKYDISVEEYIENKALANKLSKSQFEDE